MIFPYINELILQMFAAEHPIRGRPDDFISRTEPVSWNFLIESAV